MLSIVSVLKLCLPCNYQRYLYYSTCSKAIRNEFEQRSKSMSLGFDIAKYHFTVTFFLSFASYHSGLEL